MKHTVTFELIYAYTFDLVVTDAPDKDSAKMAAVVHFVQELQNTQAPFIQVNDMSEDKDEYFLRKSEVTHFRVINIAAHYEDFVETTANATSERVSNEVA